MVLQCRMHTREFRRQGIGSEFVPRFSSPEQFPDPLFGTTIAWGPVCRRNPVPPPAARARLIPG
jgi:hypothetical protein